MINFIDGKINLSAKYILTGFNHEDLDSLAREGLIEKRENGRGITYYYVETVLDDVRLSIFIRLRVKTIEWLRLHWLDSPMKGWDDVSEKGVRDEYRLLSDLVEKSIGRPPDNKKSRQLTWRLKWGKVDECYDLRAFQADIFMKPQ